MGLTVDSAACRRGGRLIFADVSFEVPDGAALVVRGPNGVGKSTLLRCLAGMVPLQAGSVTLGDTSLAHRGLMQEQTAYAGHLDAVKPAFSVQQNLALWLILWRHL